MASRAFCLALLLLLSIVAANEETHQYEDMEPLTLWVSKVGPYYNPQETYSYDSLPFCSAIDGNEKKIVKSAGLGEALEGNELVSLGYPLAFNVDTPSSPVCHIPNLSPEAAASFRSAVVNHYWYQLYLDDLPIWGMVGEIPVTDDQPENLKEGHKVDHSKDEAYIFTHKRFSIASSPNGQIIAVNLTSENPVLIEEGANLMFTYQVTWAVTDIPFENRFDVYLDYNFFEHEIHWFSILNSFMMVVFLVGLVAMILTRTLRGDFARYAKEHDQSGVEDHDVDDSGWKQVHGDVFRAPSDLALFSALLGTGSQLLLLTFCLILISIAFFLYRVRGSAMTSFLVVYALTSLVSGYVSGAFYSKHKGASWQWTMFLAATLFPASVFLVLLMLNFVATSYHSAGAASAWTVISVVLIWALVSLPLHLFGTLIGRHRSGTPDYPRRINPYPRPIPPKKWYFSRELMVILGGILPFGSIFIEMYFVFTSFWNYKVYYVYGFMLLVFLILCVVTMCVTIVISYFLLNAEDYLWMWTVFGAGASTSVYVLFYSVYYFLVKTKMSGLIQTLFYFGYTLIFCSALGILAGTVGYLGASFFIHYIYTNLKVD